MYTSKGHVLSGAIFCQILKTTDWALYTMSHNVSDLHHTDGVIMKPLKVSKVSQSSGLVQTVYTNIDTNVAPLPD